ncbi:glycosyltransferase [Bacillus sp. AFS040349]|uniref:glycosyltransferase n=1 Tax=Bacillus sp. AFS040349 TaxID=2033502 RepID=UPI000BFD03A1|nr:glycosyltransferase [Bacillus sp. AFS040349]PGT81117.1 glycosyl transferase [Bacillus sp. AFS040349]
MVIDIVLGRATGRGGLEKVLTQVSKGLKQKGHRVRICQMSEPDHLDWVQTLPEIHYYEQLDKYKYEGNIDVFSLALGYREFISIEGKPDIVLATHTPIQSLICRLALEPLGEECPPIISWLHGPPESYGGEKYLYYSDAHLAISYNIYKKIEDIVDSDSIIHYIGNPVDIDNVELINRSTGSIELLYVGRLDNTQKRLDILFKALSKVNGNWRLRIVGDGPHSNELKFLAKQLDIEKKIIWDGWRENPWNYIDEASLLVLSSDFEGFGLVLVEALSRGIPVLSTECEGPDEIIKDGVNGWLYPIGDIETLQYILNGLISGEISLPDRINCKESVVHYRPEVVVNQLEEILLNYTIIDDLFEKLKSFKGLTIEEITTELYEALVSKKINIDILFSFVEKRYPKPLLSKWLTNLGVLFWETEKFDFVIPALKKAIDYSSNNEDALFNLGFVLKSFGESELSNYYLNQIANKTQEVIDLIKLSSISETD